MTAALEKTRAPAKSRSRSGAKPAATSAKAPAKSPAKSSAKAKPVDRFSLVRYRAEDFKDEGLRSFFQYRDLGIGEATGGRCGAHIVRAKRQKPGGTGEHRHFVEFHLVYILKGWCKFHYEGQGEVRVSAGDCIYQPPGIRHNLFEYSDDLEFMEVIMPKEYRTEPPGA